MSMTHHIVEYIYLYSATIGHDIPLSDNVQAFKLLDGANLSEDEHKLKLTLANEIKFETMRSALKCIFTVHPDNNESDALKSVSLNQEEVYYENQK